MWRSWDDWLEVYEAHATLRVDNGLGAEVRGWTPDREVADALSERTATASRRPGLLAAARSL